MRRFILCSYLSVKYKVTAAQKLETRVNSRPTVVLSNGCKIRLPAPLKLTNRHCDPGYFLAGDSHFGLHSFPSNCSEAAGCDLVFKAGCRQNPCQPM